MAPSNPCACHADGVADPFLVPSGAEPAIRMRALETPTLRDALARHISTGGDERFCLLFTVGEGGASLDRNGRISDLCEGRLIELPVTALPRGGEGHLDEASLAEIAKPIIEGLSLDPNLTVTPLHTVYEQPSADRPAMPQLKSPAAAQASSRADPAFVSVPAIAADSDAARSLPGLLRRTVETRGYVETTFLEPDGRRPVMTYHTLAARAANLANELVLKGLRPGAFVILQAPRPRFFLVAFWAAILAGLRPVPIGTPQRFSLDDAVAARLVDAATHLFDNAAILCESEVAPALAELLPACRIIELLPEAADPEPVERFDPSFLKDPAAADAGFGTRTAFCVLTSGSTGRPKIVPLAHRTLLAQCRAAVAANALGPDDLTLNWLPMDHVGGIIMSHLRCLIDGTPQVHATPQLFLEDPVRFVDWLSEYRAAATWGPNFAYNLVAEQLEAGRVGTWDLTALRCVLSGGEAVVREHAFAFSHALAPYGLDPRAMRPIWGMSETASGSILSHDFAADCAAGDDGPVSLGRPIPGNAIRIAGEDGSTLCEGETGRLEIRGETVFEGYLDNPDANAASFTADGWFDTGDLGVIEMGRLRLVGRAKDAIIVHGQNIDPARIDAAVETVAGVKAAHAAAFAYRAKDDASEKIAIVYAAEPDAAPHGEMETLIRCEISRRFGVAPAICRRVRADDIPRVGIGKIQRDLLRRRICAEDAPIVALDAATCFHRRFVAATPAGDPLPREVSLVHGVDADPRDLLTALRRGGIAARPVSLSQVVRDGIPGTCETIVALASVQWSSAEWLGLFRTAGRAARTAKGLRLLVLDHHVQEVCAGDPIEPDRALGIGFLRALSREVPALDSRHVDTGRCPQLAGSELLGELADRSREFETAWRDGKRFVSRLAATAPSPLLPTLGATAPHIVLCGGFGGIGVHLIASFLTEQGAKIVVLGRRGEDELSGAAAALVAQHRGTGQLAYYSVDVLDRLALLGLEPTIHTALGGRIDAVVHLAGTHDPMAIAEARSERIDASLALRCEGTRILYGFARRLKAKRLSLFGSLNGYFAGAGLAAYAAGNRFQEAFALAHTSSDGPAVSFHGWSMWRDTGVSGGFTESELTRRNGYRIFEPSDAAPIAVRMIMGETGAFFQGLNVAVPAVRAEVAAPTLPRFAPMGHISAAALAVRHGKNEAAAQAMAGPAVQNDPIVAIVTRLWRDLLELEEEIDQDDNIFELGAHSLLIPRIQKSLREAFSTEIDLLNFFEFPVINDFCHQLRETLSPLATEPARTD